MQPNIRAIRFPRSAEAPPAALQEALVSACNRSLTWRYLLRLMGCSGAKAQRLSVQAAYLFNFGKIRQVAPIAAANRSALSRSACSTRPIRCRSAIYSRRKSVSGKPVTIKRLANGDARPATSFSSARARSDLKDILAAVAASRFSP